MSTTVDNLLKFLAQQQVSNYLPMIIMILNASQNQINNDDSNTMNLSLHRGKKNFICRVFPNFLKNANGQYAVTVKHYGLPISFGQVVNRLTPIEAILPLVFSTGHVDPNFDYSPYPNGYKLIIDFTTPIFVIDHTEEKVHTCFKKNMQIGKLNSHRV